MSTIDMQDVEENQPAAAGQLDLNSDEDFVNEVISNLREARKHLAEWRVSARNWYDFHAGRQWDEIDSQALEKQKRPVVTFNRIARTINAVSGLELQNRQEVRYLARRIENIPTPPNYPPMSIPGYAEKLNDAAKWVRDNCDAEDEESEAFQDALICGYGWTETRIDYEEDLDGQIKEDRIDPLEMIFDPNAKKANLTDACWVAHIKEFTKKEFKEMFPNVDLSSITPGYFWNDSEADPHDAQNAWRYENDQSDKLSKTNRYTVIHYQYYDREPCYRVATPDGNVLELSQVKFAALQPMLDMQGMRYIKQMRRVYKRAFICGKTLLERSEISEKCKHFTFSCITGIRDRNKNVFFGLVALMVDPQKWANKWLSQIMHIVNSGAKTGIIYESGSIPNKRKFEENYAMPGAISEVAEGALAQGRIKEKEMPRYPDGVDRLLQYAIQSINDVVGVNLEILGMAERDQPIGLEETRKQAAITVLANFFSALRHYRKKQGRLLEYFIKEYISDGRLIRILGPEGAQYVPLIKDDVAFDYDIIVDDSPTSPNMKSQAFLVLNQLIPLCLSAGIPVPPDVLDYAPLPESLIQKWKQMIAQSGEDPIQDQLKQINLMIAFLEAQEKKAVIDRINSEIPLNYAKAEQAHAIGQDETAQSMQKLGLTHAETQMKLEATMLEQKRKDLEMVLNQQRKMLEMRLNAKLKAQQANQPV